MNTVNTNSPVTGSFAAEAAGYNKYQVNAYIKKLSDEYQILQNQFAELSEKYNALTSRPDHETDMKYNAIAKALVDAEIKAAEIIADARNEASQIIGKAHIELYQIRKEKDKAISEINNLTSRLQGLIPAG